MANAGRKRRQNVKRYPGGRIKPRLVIDKGCDGVQRRQLRHEAMWGPRAGQATDAAGRAWAGHLLTDLERDAVRVFARAYWSMIPGGSGTSTLAQFVPEIRNMAVGQWLTQTERDERTKRREQMIIDITNKLDALGRHVRRAFDMLAIDQHIDDGPPWLDRLLAGQGHDVDHEMMEYVRRGIKVLY